jgi:hypothetical protein
MRSNNDAEDDAGPSKKRKVASDAERLAIELSRINISCGFKCSLQIDNTQVSFPESARQFQRSQCTWRDDRANPCYCEKARLKFEASLPDRGYLTRFSVQCLSCYNDKRSAVHLYCAYCDEVLTGSIAGPGGKVSDHLITIRHVYQQALVLKASLESGNCSSKTLSQAREYVAKLDDWSEKIRYPMRTNVKRIHLEEVLRALHQLISGLCAPPTVNCADRTWAPLIHQC